MLIKKTQIKNAEGKKNLIWKASVGKDLWRLVHSFIKEKRFPPDLH